MTMVALNPKALGEPIKGPGKWVRDALAHRDVQVAACNALGPVTFEFVKLPGYDKHQQRCTRCKRMKRHHK